MNLFTRITHRDLKSKAKGLAKDPIFWVRFSAYAIPLAFLLYVLYMNFLPFGYHKTFVIDVGTEGDTSGEFYLEPARTLSERKVAPDGTTYRELNGPAYAVFKPKAVLKDATITVSVEGDGVSIIPPVIDFDPSTIAWDYEWDFTKGIPSDLVGNAFMFDGEATFNGRDTRLELPDSADLFEDGPFTLYAEWTPKDDTNNAQQIVGHYNWELLQNKDNVSFQIGRTEQGAGLDSVFYSTTHKIAPEFFNKKHRVVASYVPLAFGGWIDLQVDGINAPRVYLNEGQNIIRKDYGATNLSFGKSAHSGASHFSGYISKVGFSQGENFTMNSVQRLELPTDDNVRLLLVSATTARISRIVVDIQRD